MKYRKLLKYLGVGMLLVAVVLIGRLALHFTFTTATPRVMETDHFSLHYHSVSKLKVRRIAKALEGQHARTTRALDASDLPRIAVHVHPDPKVIERALGFATAGAIRGVGELHIAQLPFPLNWMRPMRETAAHEFVHNVTLHLLTREAMARGKIQTISDLDDLYGKRDGKRFDEVYPRWLWESVAVYEAQQYNPLAFRMATKKGFPNLNQLNGRHNQVYHVGYALIDFVLREWGREKLLELIVEDGDVKKVLEIPESEFEEKLSVFVRDNYEHGPMRYPALIRKHPLLFWSAVCTVGGAFVIWLLSWMVGRFSKLPQSEGEDGTASDHGNH